MNEIQETQNGELAAAPVETDPLAPVLALLSALQDMNPLGDGYAQVSTSGYKGTAPTVFVYFGERASFHVNSMADLRENLRDRATNSEAHRRAKIAALEKELAELKGEA